MIGLIEEKLSDLRHLCQPYRVARLEVFGSAVKGGHLTLKQAIWTFWSSFFRWK